MGIREGHSRSHTIIVFTFLGRFVCGLLAVVVDEESGGFTPRPYSEGDVPAGSRRVPWRRQDSSSAPAPADVAAGSDWRARWKSAGGNLQQRVATRNIREERVNIDLVRVREDDTSLRLKMADHIQN